MASNTETTTVVEGVKPPQRARSISSESSFSSDESMPVANPKQWTKGAEAKRKPTTLPNETVEYLKAWMMSPEHVAHPYPTEVEKAKIMEETGLELKQLTNWFVNNRKRYWKPRVEARLKDQGKSPIPTTKRDSSHVSSDESVAGSADIGTRASKRRMVMVKRSFEEHEIRATTTSPVDTPVRVVIEESSSSASVSDGVTSSDDDEESSGRIQHSTDLISSRELCTEETVDVHILRPTDGRTIPELADVTVLQNIPAERILQTFESCALTYRYPDAKKAQSRRDAEIVRMKKHYLSIYLAKADPAKPEEITVRGSLSLCSALRHSEELVHVVPMTPRPKYRRRSVELWKEACQTAGHVYDQELPSLEEATLLFGYSM